MMDLAAFVSIFLCSMGLSASLFATKMAIEDFQNRLMIKAIFDLALASVALLFIILIILINEVV